MARMDGLCWRRGGEAFPAGQVTDPPVPDPFGVRQADGRTDERVQAAVVAADGDCPPYPLRVASSACAASCIRALLDKRGARGPYEYHQDMRGAPADAPLGAALDWSADGEATHRLPDDVDIGREAEKRLDVVEAKLAEARALAARGDLAAIIVSLSPARRPPGARPAKPLDGLAVCKLAGDPPGRRGGPDHFFTLVANSTGLVCVVGAWDGEFALTSMPLRPAADIIIDLHIALNRPRKEDKPLAESPRAGRFAPRGIRGGLPRVTPVMAADAMLRLFGRNIGDDALRGGGFARVTSIEFGVVRGTFVMEYGDSLYPAAPPGHSVPHGGCRHGAG